MKMTEGMALRKRRAIGGGIAAATAGAVILASAVVPSLAANALAGANPADPSAAQGQILQLPADLLGGIEVASLGHTLTSNPSAAGSELAGINLSVLEALNIDIGTLNLPLLTDGTTPGLLRLGDLGAAQSFSHSPSLTQSTASSGLITSGGAIDTGRIDGSADPAQLELTGLLDQLGLSGVTDGIIDQASVSIGALAARATESSGTVDSAYRIADLGIDLHSDTIAGLSTTLAGAIQGTVAPVDALIGTGGALHNLLGTVSGVLDALSLSALGIPLIDVSTTGSTVSIDGLATIGQTVTDEVLLTPLENTTGSVLVDLSDGTVSVDLAKILVETGVGADLNSMPANTPVLSAATIAAIQQGVTSALTGTHANGLLGKITTILTTTLNALQVNLVLDVNLSALLLLNVDGKVTVSGSLAQFAGTDATPPTVETTVVVAGLDLGTLLNPVIGAVTGAIAGTTGPLVNTALTSVIPLLQPALAGLTTPLLTALDPVLQGVLSGVATITINEQPTAAPISAATGDLPGGSFTVRALAINLLPAVAGGVGLDLASATVKADNTAAVAAIDAATTVPAGTNLAVTGTGWPANTSVSLQLTAPGGGANVGGPVTVTTDASGNFTAQYPVPSDATPATGYTVTATAGAVSATDTTEVTAGDPGDVNTNAAASASASADATANGDPAAEAAAIAAALSNATSTASAASTADATAAAQAAATASASTGASADATTMANAQAAAAAQAAAQADNSTTTTANSTASTAANANSSASSQAAATADASVDASSEASTNANATASATASANADASTAAVAQAAAQAAAYSDSDASASAAATTAANAAAQSAATATSSSVATADATSAANAGAAIAAQAAALANATSNTNADTSATSDASTNANSNAGAAAIANASTSASANAVAAANATADANTNATASAAASASADNDNNVAAQAAADPAALADESTTADAAATANAEAAAKAAASTTADASTDATTAANAAAAASAQAAAQNDATSTSAADTSAAANADPNAAAAVAANATSSDDASATAAANASASTNATADANTNATASAAASASADNDNNAAAQAAADPAALADESTTADAAATANAEAAAKAAASTTADASTDATTAANAAAAASAQAAANNDATSTSAADTSASADADPNAAAAVAANATSSDDASATAAANASASATTNTNANANASADPAGKLGITVKVPVLERGQQQTAIGTGFKPGEVVTGVMNSVPLALGTQVANAQGTVTFTWAIPAGTDLGTHSVTLTGAESGSVAGSFQVVAKGLATTGGEGLNGWIVLGALVVMFGLGTALVARRRVTAAAE